MGMPAAKLGDRILAVDTHIVMVPSASGQVPTPLPHPFAGILGEQLSRDVNIEGRPAATQGSVAWNTPPHLPVPPGAGFQKPPSNRATVEAGSPTVRINGKAAARAGDPALTCNDPTDLPAGQVVAAGSVLIG